MVNVRAAGLVVALLMLAGCRGRKADLGMSDSAFVQVMGELKAIADSPFLSEQVRGQQREAALRKAGVSAAQIEKLADELTAHPQHAKRLWTAIELKAMRVQRPERR